MSDIGNKIRSVFGSAAILKNPHNYDVFLGRNLPSFVKDFLISQYMTPEGGLRKQELIRYFDEHIPGNNHAVKARLRNGETLTLLTRFIISTNLIANKVQFQIPDMGIRPNETLIPPYLIEQYPYDLIDGEKWGLLKVVYMPPDESGAGHVELVDFKPFKPLQKLDLNLFRQFRSAFSIEEWVDVIISAMEYNPSSFESFTQKLEFITRLLPFIEPHLNMVELAPKGSGKSYVFGNLSKYSWLVSGGTVSRAKLFYDKARKTPGIMHEYDLVAFDEVQSITFTDTLEMRAILKSYLENGKATVDNYEFLSECGLMLLGNIELSREGYPLNDRYFDELPPVFHESALLDRFHGFIEGWLLPRMNNDMILRDWTINVEFFSEVMHKLRIAPEYAELVNSAIYIPDKADTRHLNAVKRIATAYCKLLFPHITSVDKLNKEEFERYCLRPAIHRRDQIRKQCANIDNERSFSNPMPDIRIKE
jgi:ATP-dependent Lon protease